MWESVGLVELELELTSHNESKIEPKCKSDYANHTYDSFDDDGRCKFGCGMTWNMYDDYYADYHRDIDPEADFIMNGGITSFMNKDTVEEFHKKYHVQGLPYSVDNFFS